jgi:two-component system response regulator MtrA
MSVVLVVEDEPDIRTLLEVRLGRMGHEVRSAESADEALRVLAEQGTPDVAVFDIVMRGQNGLQLLQRLRNDPACARFPVILLTARELDSDIEAAKELGAIFLKKPIVAASLTDAISSALQMAH